MRVILPHDPFAQPQDGWFLTGAWPASWIAHPAADTVTPAVYAFRLAVTVSERRTIRIHVSADQRYALFLDGALLGRGPERGDVTFWRYETYDVELSAGVHTFLAQAWWLGSMAPMAQMTSRPGFLLAAESEDAAVFGTGHADWQVKRLPAYRMTPHAEPMGDFNSFTGPSFTIDGTLMDWNPEGSDDTEWVSPVSLVPGHNQSQAFDWIYGWTLAPALLPPMLNVRRQIGKVRHIDALAEGPSENRIVEKASQLEPEAGQWNALLMGTAEVTVPAHTKRRIIVDLEDYYCAYPQLTVSGGKEARVDMLWAEALYVPHHYPNKGNRDNVDGRQFVGFGDHFLPDGGKQRSFAPLWWRAGRYVEISIVTQQEPLTLNSLVFDETRYPFEVTCDLDCSDPRLPEVAALCIRAIETGSHEVYTDCPYYEQVMYVGDSRVEALTAYVMTTDDRLTRKSIALFDQSRGTSGLTASRYPSRHGQIIPPYSLFWVAMAHDSALWRSGEPFIRSMLPGVRSVMEAYLGFRNRDGLVQQPRGWNFMDWVPAWYIGTPPDGQDGVSAILNWQFVYVLKLASELEQWFGDPVLARRLEDTAAGMVTPLMAMFYDDARGLIADDAAHTRWSEHAQCLALLSGCLPDEQKLRIGRQLCIAPDLDRATIYFSHYLFETYRELRRPDLIFDRLGLWFALKGQGLKTTIEQPEPSRSDNHGWGAHPLYHYFASILGIRPAAPGFSRVVIEPQLGPLTWAKGTMPHPLGPIEISLANIDGGITGTVALPPGLSGELRLNAASLDLHPGAQKF